jgi:hypothetical protein
MSKCEFTIELERDDATYAPGDRVRGRVHFRANEDFEHRRIVLVREWRTHGRGNRDSGGTEEIELESAGMCRAGDTMTFPFDVAVPAGPYTYHGHYINVDWYLEARADIARAIDPRGEREIVLLPGAQRSTEHVMGDVALDGTTDAIDKAARTQRKVQNVVFSGVAAFLLIFGLVKIIDSGLLTGTLDPSNAGGLMVGALLLIPGIWLSFRQARNTLAQRRLGAITLTVTPRQVRPGGTVNVRLHSPAVTDATIDGAKLKLAGKEIVTRGSGTDRTTHIHVLHEQELQLIDLPHAVRHGPMDVSGDVTLPADAGYSFRASDNRLHWTITARLSLPGWADWHEEIELIVRP